MAKLILRSKRRTQLSAGELFSAVVVSLSSFGRLFNDGQTQPFKSSSSDFAFTVVAFVG
jgi:hypothetical protein